MSLDNTFVFQNKLKDEPVSKFLFSSKCFLSALIIACPVNVFPTKVPAKIPDNILRGPPFTSFVLFSIVSLILFICVHSFHCFYSVFMLTYSFRQAFWLNWITVWTFFKTNPWFNVCFKILMCIRYWVLLYKLATSFSTLFIFIFSGKNGKSLWRLSNFSRSWTSTSRKYLLSLSSF